MISIFAAAGRGCDATLGGVFESVKRGRALSPVIGKGRDW
jgi:hypothetical protein